jgi:tRNA(Ile)-lysidine synthase
MASSRRSSPADRVAAAPAPPRRVSAPAASRLEAAVETALARHRDGGAPVVVALSGGRDSAALLDVVAACAPRLALTVSAIHVDHGLSPHAERWSRFCADLCAARAIPFALCRVEVPRSPRVSVEAAARQARYAALAEAANLAGAAAVLLAHHQDDQAETVLLQLLRGAGPAGLAAMPRERADAQGLCWVRPFIDVPRAVIDAYVRERALAFVEDDSNADTRYTRNELRLRVTPALASLAPGYPATVARAATWQAESVALADELAALDARDACAGATLDAAILRALAPHRARNLLRWFLRGHGLPPPSAARLDAMHAQLATARSDARVRLRHAGREIGMHRGRVVVHPAAPTPFECVWRGEAVLAFAHGTLEFVRARGSGLSAACLAGERVVVRSRRGGERLQIAANRPARAL